MRRMTAKYTAALNTVFVHNLPLDLSLHHYRHDELYKILKQCGFAWNSHSKVWEWNETVDEPTPLKIRVWTHADEVEGLAEDIIAKLKQSFDVVEKSKVYLCRPPKQAEGRVYISLLKRCKC